MTSGEIIFDTRTVGLTQFEARKECLGRGRQVLPRIEQLGTLDEHGLQEVLAFDYEIFWTATLCQGDVTCARSFAISPNGTRSLQHVRTAKFSAMCVAESDAPSPLPQEGDCAEEAKNLKLGQSCTTSKQVAWQRVQTEAGLLGWKNLITKQTLFDAVKSGVNQEQAVAWCVEQNQLLPTSDQIIELFLNHGLKEVFSDLNDYYYWTSSPHRQNPEHFGASYGKGGVWGGMNPKSGSGPDNAARCMVQD